jgi:hypothetical protein
MHLSFLMIQQDVQPGQLQSTQIKAYSLRMKTVTRYTMTFTL